MKKTLKFMKEHKQFTFFGILAVLIILAAVFAPVLTGGVDPLKGSLTEALEAPSKEHIFGTDKMGRDIYARVIYGARASLTSTFGVVILIFLVGSVVGVIAGYFGGKIDAILMRIADMMLAFPGLVLALAVAGIMGASIRNAIIAIVAVNWTKYARLARSLVMKIRDRDYVAAAVVTGSKTPYMLLRYMLPNALPTLIITAATDVGGMMLEIAALSFLGFGAKPPTPEWGYMLNEGRACMQSAPWMMLYPGLAIFLVVVVFNMLGDSIRDILDPRDEEGGRKMLKIDNITIAYKDVPTVVDFSLDMAGGQIVSLVGESGSGKTTVIRAVLGLLAGGGKVTRGDILFNGKSLLKNTQEQWRNLRGSEISMIFQDSGAMMNPTRKIGAVFTEYLQTHEKISKKDAWAKGEEMLEKMRLPSPDNIMRSYPFQLSGGMRQRVGIAMGMTYQPKLLLADEPTSALDVTTQAQIVRQMMELRDDYGTGIIVVTHNLGVAAYMSDYIVVMKDGHIEDQGDRDHILHHSENDYTRRLLSAVPSMGGESYV